MLLQINSNICSSSSPQILQRKPLTHKTEEGQKQSRKANSQRQPSVWHVSNFIFLVSAYKSSTPTDHPINSEQSVYSYNLGMDFNLCCLGWPSSMLIARLIMYKNRPCHYKKNFKTVTNEWQSSHTDLSQHSSNTLRTVFEHISLQLQTLNTFTQNDPITSFYRCCMVLGTCFRGQLACSF